MLSGKNMCQGGKPDTGKFHSSYIGMNVCDSAYENGCVVNGTCATAAYYYYLGDALFPQILSWIEGTSYQSSMRYISIPCNVILSLKLYCLRDCMNSRI